MEVRSSKSSNQSINFYKAYKSMIFIDEFVENKIISDVFLINITSIPNFIKVIEEEILPNKKMYINSEKKINKLFKNYKSEKKIKLYYEFEECEKNIKQNLEKENAFIIVDKSFFDCMKINIDNKNKMSLIINIDKIKSINSIKFQNSDKYLNFIELRKGIYFFNEKKIVKTEPVIPIMKINDKNKNDNNNDKNNNDKNNNDNDKNNNNKNNNDNNKNNNKNNIVPLLKIHSNYIIYIIFSFIEDENYLLKLIKYSKISQKKLNINILNYEEKYKQKIRNAINNRINIEQFILMPSKGSYVFDKNPNELSDELNKELLKYEIKSEHINECAIDYFNNYYNNLNNKDDSLYEYSKDITLDSPFFDILSNQKYFNKIFDINIYAKKIKELTLKDRYKKMFEKLNKSNIEYSSITLYNDDTDDINLLKYFNINFKNIKKLRLIHESDAWGINFAEKDYMSIINSFNIQNNLVYFEFELSFKLKNVKQFEIINKFEYLRYLGLSYIDFSTIFELKLKNLKHLKIYNCNNISFKYCNFSNIKYLELDEYNKKLEDKNKNINKNLLKCPEVETLVLIGKNNDLVYNSLIKLKKFIGEINNFLLLTNINLLEEIYLTNYVNQGDIEQMLSVFLNDEKNKIFNSATKIKLKICSGDLNLDKFLNLFPNLNKLICETRYYCNMWTCDYEPTLAEKKIIITENENSKIDDIKIFLSGEEGITLNIRCSPYNKIKSFDLSIDAINLESNPFFNNSNNIIFNSLETFKFVFEEPNATNSAQDRVQLINNIYNNIEKMPNLKEFYFSLSSIIDIDENFFNNFIQKVMTLSSIKKIYIEINSKSDGSLYSIDELKVLFPEIDFKKFHKIDIYKFSEIIHKIEVKNIEDIEDDL